MKTPVKDLVVIVVALIVILGCGFGLGKRFGPAPVTIDAAPRQVESADFVEEVLSKLSESLDLSEAEQEAITPDIEASNRRMEDLKKRARFEAYLAIRDLHESIGPKLSPAKQEKLRKSRDTLQKSIELQFPSLLDESESTTGGGSETREERP